MESVRKHRRHKIFKREYIPLYIMASPALIYLLIWSYIPLVGLVMAFQKLDISKGIFNSPFVGYDNFKFLFATTDAFIITRNVVLYNVVGISLGMGVSVVAALSINMLRSPKIGKTLQTIYMMPYFLSWSVVSIIVLAFLDNSEGMVNSILRLLGRASVQWYTTKWIWPPLLVFVGIWKGAGYQTVLFLAAITSISTDYYEAAVLDGASKIQQARYITLPHLRFVASISLILAMGSLFRGDFGLFYLVTQGRGALFPVTGIIDTYVYRSMFTLRNFGMASAANLYQSAIGFLAVIGVNYVVGKIDPESALF